MRIAVIGCTHAGTAAIINARRLYPDATITVYERNDTISFLSCGIALYVGGVVKDQEALFYSSPEQMTELGIRMKMNHEVIELDPTQKTLRARHSLTGVELTDTYDKLLITTGSWPILPPISGINLNNIHLCKTVDHSTHIAANATNARNIVVIGAGYIGIELVEAFESQGKRVTLIDSCDRILSKYLDEEITEPIEQLLRSRNIELALNQTATQFVGQNGNVSKVMTTRGEYDADLVILCVGFRPQTHLLKGHVDMLENGAIIVDEYMRTSQPDLFAAGDCCAVMFNPLKQPKYVPLATNAIRMGTIAAHNLCEPKLKHPGTQGTSGIKLYDRHIASTGLTEQSALDAGLNAKSITIAESVRPDFMPTNEVVTLKVVYDAVSRQLLGAQLMSKADLTQAINTLSVCIQNGMTMEQLALTDFFFQPHFNKPWHFVNQAALHAL
ncbi:FAD-dependent oxidoreductase [Laceyella putida]|uniref:FAD-dependent oxidoreductase n=1 Tax=Laceyella putida TaxID=110101 RepID=A0ABW2RIX9_9BACL